MANRRIQPQKVYNDLERQQKGQSPPPTTDHTAFSIWRRRLIVVIVTFTGCLGPLAANVHCPIYTSMAREFNKPPQALDDTKYMFMSVSAVSALVWAQLSDVYGRRCVYLISLSFLFVSNLLLTALPADTKTLYGLKALQAIGSSSVYSVGIATIVDITPVCRRSRRFGYFMVGSCLGSVIGPIISVYHLEDRWRWAFGLLTAMNGLALTLIWFLLPETSKSVVGTGGQFRYTLFQERTVPYDGLPNQKLSLTFYFSLLRHRTIIFSSILDAVIISDFYVVCFTLGQILTERTDYSPHSISIAYLCPAICLMVGSILSGCIIDGQRKSKYHDNQFEGHLICSSGPLETGLLLFGFCMGGEKPIPEVGFSAVTILSLIVSYILIRQTTYLTECVKDFPASVVAFSMLLRSVGSIVAYIIVQQVTKRIGIWCQTIFCFVCLACLVMLQIIWYYGYNWRRKQEHLLG